MVVSYLMLTTFFTPTLALPHQGGGDTISLFNWITDVFYALWVRE